MSKLAYVFKAVFWGLVIYAVCSAEMLHDSVKGALCGICVLFIISPGYWFWAKNLFCKIFKRNQVTGVPDRGKLNILIMLFRLRYLEMYNIYSRLRYWQEEAAPDENWISLYLNHEKSYLSEVDYYDKNKEEKIRKKKEKARTVCERYFNFKEFSWDTDRWIAATTDLKIELTSVHAVPMLRIIKSFGCFEKELSSLIKNYEFLDNTWQEGFGQFDDFIINRVGKAERRDAYHSIDRSWNQLFTILKAYLIFFEDKEEEMAKDLSTSLLEEMDLLQQMISGLSGALDQQNAKSKRAIGSPLEASEKAFFAKFDSDHLWRRSFL